MAIKPTGTVSIYLKQLETMVPFFAKMQETRQNKFNGMSDAWLESDKADDEQENLDLLESINEKLGESLDEMNDLFDEAMF